MRSVRLARPASQPRCRVLPLWSNPMSPAGSSPVVAWLASDEAQHVTGQVIRVIGDTIYLMRGWSEETKVSSGNKRWDATTLGQVLATDIFRTRAPGLR